MEIKFDLEYRDEANMKACISTCQCLDHVQQVAFSTYHGALTQTCFTCKKVRTSMNKNDVACEKGEVKG